MAETFDTKKAVEAQRDFCHKNEIPMFAPSDGSCYYCGKDIYKSISVEDAGSTLVTGCPHCNHSFVD